MISLDLIDLEETLLSEKYSKEKTIVVDIFFKENYIPSGCLKQEGLKDICLNFHWYRMEKMNIATMKVCVDSVQDSHNDLLNFLDSRGYKYFSTNQ